MCVKVCTRRFVFLIVRAVLGRFPTPRQPPWAAQHLMITPPMTKMPVRIGSRIAQSSTGLAQIVGHLQARSQIN